MSGSSGEGDVSTYFQENKIPGPFLVMLIIQFFLIVIDRAIFLKKSGLAKFVFLICLLIVIHIWMFFLLPILTQRNFVDNTIAQLWYFSKCMYFGFSAYQIKCGYPSAHFGNFLTRKYGYTNLFLFKGFLAIPFLLELRAIMDWMWTQTTLSMGHWLMMEDIYCEIFLTKCWREAERRYPTPRGIPRAALVKYGVGGLIVFIIIMILWFPLVIFSFANMVYVPYPPVSCTATVSIGGYEPLFTVNVQEQGIRNFTDKEFAQLHQSRAKDRGGSSFLSNFERVDIVTVDWGNESTALWAITPPAKQRLMKELRFSPSRMALFVDISISREPMPGGGSIGETLREQLTHELTPQQRQQFADIINKNNSGKLVEIWGVYPRFIRAPSNKALQTVSALIKSDDKQYGMRLNAITGSPNTTERGDEWWSLNLITTPNKALTAPGVVMTDGEGGSDEAEQAEVEEEVSSIIFSDRVAPNSILDWIAASGILGLYLSVVLVIGRFMRGALITEKSHLIQYTEMPQVDGILRLCLEIYMVRHALDFEMEEELFARLIFLYRSPETRVKFTKKND